MSGFMMPGTPGREKREPLLPGSPLLWLLLPGVGSPFLLPGSSPLLLLATGSPLLGAVPLLASNEATTASWMLLLLLFSSLSSVDFVLLVSLCLRMAAARWGGAAGHTGQKGMC